MRRKTNIATANDAPKISRVSAVAAPIRSQVVEMLRTAITGGQS